MKTKPHGCLISLAIILGLFVLWVAATAIGGRLAVRKYDGSDHAALLAACREMLANRLSFTNSPSFRAPHSWEGTTISLTRDPTGFGPEIPRAIRELNPRYIVIHEDSLIVSDPPSFPPMRRGVIAFPADAEFQYGTEKYIDGLWYWNGNLNASVRPEFDRRMEEKLKQIKANQVPEDTARKFAEEQRWTTNSRH